MNFLPLIVVLLPIVGVLFLIPVSKGGEQKGSVLTAITCGFTFLGALLIYANVSASGVMKMSLNPGLPLILSFRVDSLGILVGVIASFVWFLASIYALEYMRPEHAKTRFNSMSLLSLCGMMGIVFAGDLFTLYIFFEMMALLSYVLVIHEETAEAKKAGLKYLFMGIVGGLFLLLAIIALYFFGGSVSLDGNGFAFLKHSPYLLILFWSCILGFGVKAGMFPVHVWLPDAHPVAPTPASALLSGVMIKAGAYGIIRTVYAVFGSDLLSSIPSGKILLVLGIITMILGSGCAIVQTEIKRLLAFSSIAQMGYIVTGTALLTHLGLTGAVLHIFNHAFMKGCLFLCAGAIIYKTGLRKLDDLKGIGHRMPITMLCFTVAALSMVGIPPFVGFVSKWVLCLGTLQAAQVGLMTQGMSMCIVGFFLLSSLLNAVYYGPIVIRAWFGNNEGGHSSGGHGSSGAEKDAQSHGGGHHSSAKVKNDDPSWMMKVPIVTLAVGVFVFGLFPNIPLSLALKSANAYFPDYKLEKLSDLQIQVVHYESETAGHGEAASSHGEAASSHGEAASSHGEAASSHGEAASSHGEAASSHGEAASSHGEAASSHGEAASSHGEAVSSHGEAVSSHGEAVSSHGEAISSHGKAVSSHGEAVSSHGTTAVKEAVDHGTTAVKETLKHGGIKEEVSIHEEKVSHDLQNEDEVSHEILPVKVKEEITHH